LGHLWDHLCHRLLRIVIQDFENIAIQKLSIHLTFYYKYVDDITLTAPSESINKILNTFNSLHSRLQFTVEVEDEGKISFLDTLLIVKGQNLIFDGFRKATFSDIDTSIFTQTILCIIKEI